MKHDSSSSENDEAKSDEEEIWEEKKIDAPRIPETGLLQNIFGQNELKLSIWIILKCVLQVRWLKITRMIRMHLQDL